MIGQRNILSASFAAFFASDAINFLSWGKWLLILACILTAFDFRFGVRAARKRGEEIRASRAIRRTINKIVDYVCWILLAFAAGEAFGKPFGIDLLPLIILLVIYGIEIESIFGHYFFCKGIKGRINIFKFFSKKTDIIEIEDSNENK